MLMPNGSQIWVVSELVTIRWMLELKTHIFGYSVKSTLIVSKAGKLTVLYLKTRIFRTLLAERHHFRLPVAERIKRFIGFATGASASKALTASATIKQAFVEFWW